MIFKALQGCVLLFMDGDKFLQVPPFLFIIVHVLKPLLPIYDLPSRKPKEHFSTIQMLFLCITSTYTSVSIDRGIIYKIRKNYLHNPGCLLGLVCLNVNNIFHHNIIKLPSELLLLCILVSDFLNFCCLVNLLGKKLV